MMYFHINVHVHPITDGSHSTLHPQNVVPPIVSLAMGSLGFLTSFFADSYQETIDRVLNSESGAGYNTVASYMSD